LDGKILGGGGVFSGFFFSKTLAWNRAPNPPILLKVSGLAFFEGPLLNGKILGGGRRYFQAFSLKNPSKLKKKLGERGVPQSPLWLRAC